MKMLWLMNYTGLEQLVIIATIIFLTILLAEIFDCTKVFSTRDYSHLNYGYEEHNGKNEKHSSIINTF